MKRHLTTIAAALLGLAASAPAASALCAASPMDGAWRNVNPDTRSITKVEFSTVCNDVIHNGRPASGPDARIHLWGSCSPSDCDWGTIGSERVDDGWFYAFKDDGFAKRHIYTRMAGSDRLRVFIRTDFTDPGREDYESDNYFVRR
ncbi:hypothetical protein P1J78_18830 [Psychromarinibacter sp. C21-152]|uniref:Uncharacterized protein n=1 Tax=Psychromarinibacter sediminicola TaxID=3033385 RepID=A0AAE3TBM1_9RHOB|nr:hypothetical protein [Psychromarinibacter sediminicola]MDF0602800.1 hypothetical protein [Psychromarinibacter sediminicola]